MNAEELRNKKNELIENGLSEFSNLSMIADTLGVMTKIRNHGIYSVFDVDGITLIHSNKIIRASTHGTNFLFTGWITRNCIFATVGDYQVYHNKKEIFRKDLVARLYKIGETSEATKEEISSQIFVPYHMDWFNKIMEFLPKTQSILGIASADRSNQEASIISKQLFLDVHPEYTNVL